MVIYLPTYADLGLTIRLYILLLLSDTLGVNCQEQTLSLTAWHFKIAHQSYITPDYKR